MYERQLSFFLDRIWISCRIGIWYPPHNFGSVAELSSHMTLLHHPAKRVALSRWHLKESWFWVSALILIGVRISGSLSFLTYVHWLPCNALWRGGYLHGSNFVNLATLQHQQPPDTNYLASLIHPTRLISPRLNSQRCNCDQGIVRQNHFRSRLCPRRLPGNVCWKYCNGNVVGSQGRRAIWE